jgi:3-dehydroquinate dehydratase-2
MKRGRHLMNDFRNEIDRIDSEILRLFQERMNVAAQIGEFKKANRLPVFDPAREREKLSKLQPDERRLFRTLFEISRERQGRIVNYQSSILVINGVNLNMLGLREPEIYGDKSYRDLTEYLHELSDELKIQIQCVQSNYEGEIVEIIQSARDVFAGIVINPGAYTHTSVAIADALKSVELPAVEVHLSDVNNREDFRKLSYIAPVCVKTIAGLGFEGYKKAIEYLGEKI